MSKNFSDQLSTNPIDIINGIKRRFGSEISFNDIAEKNSQQVKLNYDPLKEKYQNYKYKTVDSYKSDKLQNPLDIRDVNFQFNNHLLDYACCHGTNLSSVIGAITNCNSQIIPGIKLRKLGMIPTTGESSGTTPLNRKYVSTIDLGSNTASFEMAIDYAKESSSVFTKSRDLVSDHVPCVVIGNAGIRESKGPKFSSWDYKNTGEDAFYTGDIGNEMAVKRLNIRIIAVEDEFYEIAKGCLEKLNVTDIRLSTISRLRTAEAEKKKRQNESEFNSARMDLKSLWESSETIDVKTTNDSKSPSFVDRVLFDDKGKNFRDTGR